MCRWLVGRLKIRWIIDVDWLIDLLINLLIGWLIGSLTYWLVDWLVDLVDWLVDWIVDLLISCKNVKITLEFFAPTNFESRLRTWKGHERTPSPFKLLQLSKNHLKIFCPRKFWIWATPLKGAWTYPLPLRTSSTFKKSPQNFLPPQILNLGSAPERGVNVPVSPCSCSIRCSIVFVFLLVVEYLLLLKLYWLC